MQERASTSTIGNSSNLLLLQGVSRFFQWSNETISVQEFKKDLDFEASGRCMYQIENRKETRFWMAWRLLLIYASGISQSGTWSQPPFQTFQVLLMIVGALALLRVNGEAWSVNGLRLSIPAKQVLCRLAGNLNLSRRRIENHACQCPDGNEESENSERARPVLFASCGDFISDSRASITLHMNSRNQTQQNQALRLTAVLPGCLKCLSRENLHSETTFPTVCNSRTKPENLFVIPFGWIKPHKIPPFRISREGKP